MDLRVKIQPKEIFIYSMYNFWAGLRGIGCIILTVLVIIAAAASEERLGTQVTNLVILGVIALTGFQIFAIWKQAERPGMRKRELRLYFTLETRASVPARRTARVRSAGISW